MFQRVMFVWNNCYFLRYSRTLLCGHSDHPLLSGQLSKSRNYFQSVITVNKTHIKRSPLLSGRGHLLVVPMRVLLLFLPLLSGDQEFNTRSLALFWKSWWQIRVQNRRWRLIKTFNHKLPSGSVFKLSDVSTTPYANFWRRPIKRPTPNKPCSTV